MKNLTQYEGLYCKNTILFKEGDTSKEMYVIRSGKVEISRKIAGIQKIITVLGPGDFFGEMSSILKKARSATATITEYSVIIKIPPDQLDEMMKKNYRIGMKIIALLVDRISKDNQQIDFLYNKDIQCRTVQYLLKVYKDHQEKEYSTDKIPLRLKEMHEITGIEIKKLKENLLKMHRSKLISYHNELLYVPKISKLKEFFHFLIEQSFIPIESKHS